MKRTLLSLIAFVAVVGMVWGLWAMHHHYVTLRIVAKPAAPVFHPPVTYAALMAAQWKDYHQVREKTMADNPDLAAEYKSLRDRIAEQEQAVNAAIIQVDPKAAPIIAKREAFRNHAASASAQNTPATNAVPPGPGPKGVSPGTNSTLITTGEWQELRVARQSAMKAHPDLMVKADQLAKDMRAFQAKLDAGMLKTDPNIGPIITRLEGGGRPPQMQPLPRPGQNR